MLLRLLRGSSSQGLAAMRESRPFAAGRLWRPLLATPRAALLEYAVTHALTWIEDPSNEDTRLDRNFLRRDVLPLLHERWPHAAAALAQSARWLEEDAALLDAEAQRRLAQAQGGAANTLSVAILLSFEPMWRARVLRAWLRSREFLPWPQSAHAVIDAEVLTARSDALPEYRWSGGMLRRWRDHLYLDHSQSELPQGWSCAWDGVSALVLPTGDTLDILPVGAALNGQTSGHSLATQAFVVRARQGGERISLPGRTHSHSLKHVLQAQGIPPWQRARLPLLFAADDELLAAGDSVLSERLQEYCRENAVRVHFQPW